LCCHYPPYDPRFDSCQARLAGGGYVLPFPLSPLVNPSACVRIGGELSHSFPGTTIGGTGSSTTSGALHLVGRLLTLIHDAQTHEHKICLHSLQGELTFNLSCIVTTTRCLKNMFIENISGPSRQRATEMLTLVAYSTEQKIIELSFIGGSERICVQEHINCNSENGRRQKHNILFQVLGLPPL